MPQEQKISELMLEQFSLGELPPDQERMVRGELERDGDLRGRLAALRASDGEILAAHPPQAVVPAIRERLLREGLPSTAHRTPRRVNPMTWALPVAAALVLFVSLFVMRERFTPDETRVKGLTPHLVVFRKTAAGAEQMNAGSLARRADVLQIGYSAAGARYGVIFSVDGRGTVTWHMPAGYAGGQRQSPSLDAQGEVVLPAAYELDDAPGFERFFLVSSPSPFDLAAVANAARTLAARQAADREPLALPQGMGQNSLLLKKQG
jgi:hypothetical protein